MSVIDQPLTSCGYWGVLNYAQIWLWSDALILGEMARDGGVFTSASLSNVLKVYSVRRGFPAVDVSADKRGRDFQRVVAAVNQGLLPSPASLIERALQCRSFAQQLAGDGFTVGLQISAVTKMSWFLNPHSWTMFDSYAARALGVISADAFYAKLDSLGGNQNGFDVVCAGISEKLAGSDWEMLRSGRIVDAILLNRGDPDNRDGAAVSSQRAARLNGFVDGLPGNTGKSLVESGLKVQELLESYGMGARLQ